MASKKIIPQRLDNFRVYDSNSNVLLGVSDVKLTSIEAMTDTFKAAGVLGEIDVPMLGQFGSMTLELNWNAIYEDVFFLAKPETHDLTLRGAIQVYDQGKGKQDTKAVKVNVRCNPKKIDLGKMEVASGQDATSEFEVVYLHLWFDEQSQIEIDKWNMVFAVQGTDYLKKMREDLGM